MTEKVTLQEYWNLRAPNYTIVDAFGRRIMKAYLDRLGFKPRSVVDIGTGKGELLHMVQDVPRVLGLDFSEEMLEFAARRVERHGWNNVDLQYQDLTKGHPDERFDLLIGRTVLMHIHPCDIEAACDNVAAMSDILMLLEMWDEKPRQLAAHNWMHDYVGLFKARGYELKESYRRPDIPQVLFIFKKEK